MTDPDRHSDPAAAVVVSGPGESPDRRSLLQEDETLLERSRAHWQMGEWDRLTELGDEALEGHPDRAKLALLAAVGFAQQGDLSRARRLARQAQDWGCGRELLARVLIGGVHNSLGRAASLLEEEERAVRHFEISVTTVSPRADGRVLGRARNIHEKARLGLLPEAAKLLGRSGEALSLAAGPDEVKTLRALARDLEARLGGAGAAAPPQRLGLPALLRRAAAEPDALPDRPLIVCTHHKTGTNFTLNVFREISAGLDLPLWLKFYDPEPGEWRICIHQHARVLEMMRRMDFAGVQIVRHPMALVYSAALYHETCREPWVDIPLETFDARTFLALSDRDTYNAIKAPERSPAERRRLLDTYRPEPGTSAGYESGYDFAGRTYRKMLAGFDTIEEKVRFEMHAFSQGVIRDMTGFPHDRRMQVVKLEDIARDTQMGALRGMFRHLGFRGGPAARCLEIAAGQCLWNRSKPRHATTGMSDEWETVVAGSLAAEFRELFGWAEQALGYTDEWQETYRETA